MIDQPIQSVHLNPTKSTHGKSILLGHLTAFYQGKSQLSIPYILREFASLSTSGEWVMKNLETLYHQIIAKILGSNQVRSVLQPMYAYIKIIQFGHEVLTAIARQYLGIDLAVLLHKTLLQFITETNLNERVLEQIWNLMTEFRQNNQYKSKTFSNPYKNQQILNQRQYQKFLKQNSSKSVQMEGMLRFIGIFGFRNIFLEQLLQKQKRYFIQLQEKLPRGIQLITHLHCILLREHQLLDALEDKHTDYSTIYSSYNRRAQYPSILLITQQLFKETHQDICNCLKQIIEKGLVQELKVIVDISILLGMKKELLNEILEMIRGWEYEVQNNIVSLQNMIVGMKNILTESIASTQLRTEYIRFVQRSIEQLVCHNEHQYNKKLIQYILQNYIELNQDFMTEQNQLPQPRDQQQQIGIFMFMLVISKENFIHQLEVQIAYYILNFRQKLYSLRKIIGFINKVRLECGNYLTKKIDRIINDLLKNDLSLNLPIYHSPSIPLYCLVLHSEWPISSYKLKYPTALQPYILELQKYYFATLQYRKLKWLPEWGRITLTYSQLTLSIISIIYASIVLLLDQAIRPMTNSQLQESLGVDESLLESALSDLLNAEIILSNSISNGKVYELRESEVKAYIHSINAVPGQIGGRTVQRDWIIIIEAAMTKLMKKRKVMQKTDLARYILEAVKNFKPSLEQMNEAIQKLVVRGIISIDTHRGTLRYIQ